MILAEKVTFAYPSQAPTLLEFSFEFHAGEVVALTGPSGRGKSTLLYLLGLMLKPTSGAITVNGTEATKMADRNRARLRAHSFGFIFQDAALDATRTVLDNVLESGLYRGSARRTDVSRAHELLEHFGVSIRANHKPGQISGGQAQRIAVCRALLGNPDIVLADEPTGNLDVDSSNTVVSALKDHARDGGLAIIATHDPRVVERCDRRVEL